MEKAIYDNYLAILKSELIPAMGCTEPIAVALAGAKAAQVLGGIPEKMDVFCSGNIVKNVKGVVVPNSGGQRGIAVAAVLGAVGGDAEKGLEVIAGASDEDVEMTRDLIQKGMCDCHLEKGIENLYIRIEAVLDGHSALVEVKTRHNHFSLIQKDGQTLLKQNDIQVNGVKVDKGQLNLHDILRFADEVAFEDIRELMAMQVSYNSAISEEGLKTPWGAQVGKTLLKEGSHFSVAAAARAAAGSDARMGGCSLPVVINSGSGNQGIALTVPLVEYAKEHDLSEEKLYRALAVANLVSCHQKKYIGNLSAYCGATSAATASAVGIAWLEGASEKVIGDTIINSIATIGGMVCDGAKSSCAAKIASAVRTALLSYEMAKSGCVFQSGEGLVGETAEETIRNIGRMGREGMKETDIEILNIMLGK